MDASKKKAYKLYKDLFWLHNASTDTEFKVNICEFLLDLVSAPGAVRSVTDCVMVSGSMSVQ